MSKSVGDKYKEEADAVCKKFTTSHEILVFIDGEMIGEIESLRIHMDSDSPCIWMEMTRHAKGGTPPGVRYLFEKSVGKRWYFRTVKLDLGTV